jgi:hypothetical protein
MAVHVSTLFEKLGQTNAKGLGVPHMGMVVMPHPLEGRSIDEVRKQAEDAIETIIGKLTRDSSELKEEAAGAEVIKIVGNDYSDAYEQFNRLFLKKRWGDGLPLIPPTKEKVDWMLTGTDLSPDELVVKETQPSGKPATVRQVAINAVMAGAIPAYMPVLIAALRAFDEIPWGWGSVATTSACAPMIVINGPIAKQLDINSKSNALGYGWRANAGIGRTIEMIFHCIGGAIPGVSDMSTLGNTHTYTSIVFAENQDVLDDIGWPSFAEEMGYDKKANTVHATITMAGYKIVFPYGGILDNPESFMDNMLWASAPVGGAGWLRGPNKEMSAQMSTWVFTPENARCFALAGWKKYDVRNLWAARASVEHSLPKKEFVNKIGLVRDSWLGEGTCEWIKALPDDHPMSTWSPDPRHTHIFVAGGAGLEGQFYPNFSSESYVKTITKEIELPKNWDEVLEEANIVPTPMPKLPW